VRFFIDENLTPDLAQPLQKIYRKHMFKTALHEGLVNIDDVELFRDLDARGFDAIITKDGKQLILDHERAGLLDAGLHWIGVSDVGSNGEHQLALFTGVVAAGLHHVLGDWRSVPHAYKLTVPSNFANMLPLVEAL
jgi:hypothetical protein